MRTQFIAEVSSNHHQDILRCFRFIEKAAEIGCDAVKFQLFKIDELFAPEILRKSAVHRQRRAWELPLDFVPQLRQCCDANNIEFSCTPFYLTAVRELAPYVHFFKIASYELLWSELISACAETQLPLVLSTGMANLDEIDTAVATAKACGVLDLTLLHCVSAYPTPPQDCNLAVIESFRYRYQVASGWSDHSRSAAVMNRAIHRWKADTIEFHLDLDKEGGEYAAGHCWLPEEIAPLIAASRAAELIDGGTEKALAVSESDDRLWRADPSDGLRPLKEIRQHFIGDTKDATLNAERK